MAKERIVHAIFSDGTVIERGSVSRLYTHAYLLRARYVASLDWGLGKKGDLVEIEKSGFSSSAAQAERNMKSETAWLCHCQATVTLREVVPVQVIEKRGAA